jgi:hypothetical protein
MRSECGARARSRKPLPGGSGPPLGRHHDRSPRSSVDSRQIEAGNARQIGSQETRELELSQRRMRSPWRVPRRSAERRAARDKSRCRAEAKRMATLARRTARTMAGAPIGAPPPFICAHDLVRKPDAIFRNHAWGGHFLRTHGGSQSSDAKTHRENDFCFSSLRGAKATKQSRTAPQTGLLRFARNDEMVLRIKG